MLALTRRQSEAIDIGDDIRVEVVAVNGGQVKLAIQAPREIPIMREEISSQGGSKPKNTSS
jgi:carbon storage regulator